MAGSNQDSALNNNETMREETASNHQCKSIEKMVRIDPNSLIIQTGSILNFAMKLARN